MCTIVLSFPSSITILQGPQPSPSSLMIPFMAPKILTLNFHSKLKLDRSKNLHWSMMYVRCTVRTLLQCKTEPVVTPAVLTILR